MPRPQRHFDWSQLLARSGPVVAADPRVRLRLLLVGFAMLLGVLLCRLIELEVAQGAAFRAEAVAPREVQRLLPAARGRILARDGTVLAHDEEVMGLAVHYRYLEEPPSARWLRGVARQRLSRAERRDASRLAQAEDTVLSERAELHSRLADLCGISDRQWRERAALIQVRVQAASNRVNERQQDRFRQSRSARPQNSGEPSSPFWRAAEFLGDALFGPEEELPPPRITLAEELTEHVVFEDLSPAAVTEISSRPDRYASVKLVRLERRSYPQGPVAAHVLGHLGASDDARLGDQTSDATGRASQRVAKAGLELSFDRLLQPRSGQAVDLEDHAGRVLSTNVTQRSVPGRDLKLTLDLDLQQTAERLLDQALAARLPSDAELDEPAGGAVLVMDVHNGALLAAASAPHFDPNLFEGGDRGRLETLLGRPDHPLFDRATAMAIPPGSVFKVVSAIALLESGVVRPNDPIDCQGYLTHPDGLRCAIYRRYGIGHGPVTLSDALAFSCNVYFFHHARAIEPAAISTWARDLGVGQPTGINLPSEASGSLPDGDDFSKTGIGKWRMADTQALAIGQSSLTMTPLQVVRLMAAVANGGYLVTPRLDTDQASAIQKVAGLQPSTLEIVREGLERAVADPEGTAHRTVSLSSLSIAGKTGTAETGEGRADHAWFAGYAPAEKPQIAFVVVLEHAGDGGSAAGPVARRLLMRMQALGYFGLIETAEKPIPPGKG